MQPRYTPAEWETYYPALKGLAITTVEIARAVLVDGKRPIDIAEERGESRQLVHAAVKRVRGVLEKKEAQGLVPVLVWLPPELAEQVREMAKPYIAETEKAQNKDVKGTTKGQKKTKPAS